MLVLSRERDLKIVIGDNSDMSANVVITVVEIRGNKVRLGIDAPKSTPVHREEVWIAIYGQQESSDTSSSAVSSDDSSKKEPETKSTTDG